ncbi:hypothetical protein AAEU28_09590 [Pseudoalteromonas sp. SS15]
MAKIALLITLAGISA